MEVLNMTTSLIIKAPNQKIVDQSVECPLNWTVLQLKVHLSKEYPSKPKPEDQKLIYSGHLLENHLSLKDVFRTDSLNQSPILHLVCTPSRESLDSSPASSKSNSQAPSPTTEFTPNVPLSSSSSSVSSASSTSSNPTSEGLRNRFNNVANASQGNVQGVQAPSQYVQFPPMVGEVPLTPEQMFQQMLTVQQMYAQYFSQYMQLINQGAAYNNVPASQTPSVPPSRNSPLPQQNAQPAPENRGPRMNAQGGPVLDDEDEDAVNRDWLDWFYVVSRATILLGIVYFYSSFGRFLVVTGIAVLVYLYQGGWFVNARRPNAQARNAGDNQEDNDERQADNEPERPPPVPNNRAEMEEDIRNIEAIMDGDRNSPIEPRVSPVAMAWTFISTFFSSLIPEQPPPVNVN